MQPTFFPTPASWRAWLKKHHATHTELLVGFYKRASGKPSIDWPESVDQALCFGWIDAVRRSLGAESYTIRFTPRKQGSVWSARNISRVEELTREGLMAPAGLKAFEGRRADRSGIYSFEQETVAFEPLQQKQFQQNPEAWEFFTAQAPSYRRPATWWVISAKRSETRVKRLAQLILCSEAKRRLPHLTPARKR